MSSAMDKPRVLYLAGAHRSGTTMLTSVLGEYEGIFAAGELHEVWDNLITGRPCGCGDHLETCPVWAPILGEVCGRRLSDPTDYGEPARWRARSARVWHTGRLLSEKGAKEPPEAARYAALMEDLYLTIARYTGAAAVVDSTKIPSGAALLLNLGGVEPYGVHLIRDPRASAYSWSKPKTKVVSGFEEKLTRVSVPRSTLQWLGYNVLTEWVGRRYAMALGSERWRRLRYEDLMSEPMARSDALASWMGADPESTPFEEPDLARLSGGHTIAGNPDRFEAGKLSISPDERWKRDMRTSDRRLAEALSLPLMGRYGYRR